jgi:hypothetical protein
LHGHFWAGTYGDADFRSAQRASLMSSPATATWFAFRAQLLHMGDFSGRFNLR